MFDTDFIIILVVILFVFYIPLCWYTESYTNDQSGGNAVGAKLVVDIAKESGKAINAGLMAPIDLLAQGVNSVINVFTSIPEDAITIGKQTIDDATAPLNFIISEFTSIYGKLNELQGSLLTNDQATSKINTEVLKAIKNIKTVMDTIVTDITTVVNTHNVKLKQFIEGLPNMVNNAVTTGAEEIAQGALTEFQTQTATAFNQINTDIGAFNTFMTQQVPVLEGAITQAATDINTIVSNTIPAVQGTANAAKASVDNIIENVLPGIQSSLSALTTGATTLQGSIENVTSTIIPGLDGLVSELTTKLGIVESTVSGITDTIIPDINTNIGSLQGTISTVQGTITGIQSDILANAGAVEGIIKTSLPLVEGAVTTLKNDMTSRFTGVTTDIAENAADVLDNAADITNAFSAIGLDKDNFIQPAENVLKQMGDNAADITNAFSAIGLDKDNFVKPADNMLQQIGNNASDIDILMPLRQTVLGLQNLYEPLSKDIAGFNTTLGQNTTKITEAITSTNAGKLAAEGVEIIMGKIETDLEKLMGLTGTLQGDATKLVTAFNTAIDNIKGHFGDAKTKLEEISSISFTAPSFAGGNSMTLKVPGVSTGFIDTIKDELERLKI